LKAFKTGLSTLLEYDVALFIRNTVVNFNAIKAIFLSVTPRENKLECLMLASRVTKLGEISQLGLLSKDTGSFGGEI
jgi:hypothetical protein